MQCMMTNAKKKFNRETWIKHFHLLLGEGIKESGKKNEAKYY